MDHLPLPIDGGVRPKVALYVETRVYTPEDFFKIPQEYGYNNDVPELLETGLREPPDKEHPWESVQEANTFLQSWLFFALLAQVLGTEIRTGDFCEVGESGETIHTTGLNQMLYEWAGAEQEVVQTEQKAQINRYIRASAALDTARRFVAKHLSHARPDLNFCEEPDKHLMRSIHNRVDKKLVLSLAIIGETLQNTRPQMATALQNDSYFWKPREAEDKNWGCSTYSRESMLERGWCPSEIRWMESTLGSVKIVYYASMLKTRQLKKGSHEEAQCKVWRCLAERKKRTALHFCQDLTKCVSKGIPREDQIIDWIKRGKTPLVTWTPEDGLEVRPFDLANDAPRFGALSHSWGEGIVYVGEDERGGNDRRILKCQLVGLQKSFNKLLLSFGEECETEPIPFWIDVLCLPRKTSARGAAINQLKTIYAKAAAVVVWDRNLLRQRKQAALHTIEMNIRIRTGYWSSRLWTLQEAVLARNIFFQFKHEEFLTLSEIEEAREKAKNDLFHENHHIWRAGYPFSSAIWHLRTGEDTMKVQRAWTAVQFRRTSAPEDEPLVLANILGLDVTAMEHINMGSPESTREERMVNLYDLLEQNKDLGIPSGIIFLPGDKLGVRPDSKKNGFEWAPATWLSQLSYCYPLFRPLNQAACLLKRGLQVQFPGVVLRLPNERYQRPVFHIPLSDCLHEWWKVRVGIGEKDWPRMWNKMSQSQSPSIIMSLETPRDRWEIGMLVVEKGTLSVGEVRWVERLCTVWFRLETNHRIMNDLGKDFRHNGNYMGFGTRLAADQKWCVNGGDSPERSMTHRKRNHTEFLMEH